MTNKMSIQAVAPPPKQSVHTLLADLVDYAGLFPPSMVTMKEAVEDFKATRWNKEGGVAGAAAA